MKKVFSAVCLTPCPGLLAGGASKAGIETGEGLLSAVAAVK